MVVDLLIGLQRAFEQKSDHMALEEMQNAILAVTTMSVWQLSQYHHTSLAKHVQAQGKHQQEPGRLYQDKAGVEVL